VDPAGALSDVVTPPGDTPISTGAVDGAASAPLAVGVGAVVDGRDSLDDEQPASSTADIAMAVSSSAVGPW
jgi:hypothetical protein